MADSGTTYFTPESSIDVPARVRTLARGATLTPVWQNQLGGLTFRADAANGASARYIKWGPEHDEVSFQDEAERLLWAARYTPVPAVIEHGAEDGEEWLVTEAINALSAVAPSWIARPEQAVRAAGRGLRALHDALPVPECPFSWSVDARIENARRRGIVVPDPLRSGPPIDRLVVCHGDACVPNTLIGDDGEWAAHVDLGALGTADRWADIAVAAMSTRWNYGPGWEDALIEAYGVEPDRERLSYYRALWDAT